MKRLWLKKNTSSSTEARSSGAPAVPTESTHFLLEADTLLGPGKDNETWYVILAGV